MQTQFWVTWFVVGILFGVGLVGTTTGIGFLVLMALLIPITLLLIGGIPGIWMGIAGVGLGVGAAWGTVMIDPNAPDDDLWPVLVGAVVAIAGLSMFRATTRTPG